MARYSSRLLAIKQHIFLPAIRRCRYRESVELEENNNPLPLVHYRTMYAGPFMTDKRHQDPENRKHYMSDATGTNSFGAVESGGGDEGWFQGLEHAW